MPQVESTKPTRFVTAADFAVQTGLRPVTVYRMIEQGRIKCVRFGRLRKIPREELERALIHGIK